MRPFATWFALVSVISLFFFPCVLCRGALKSQERSSNLPDTDVPYGIADWSETLGNHRARVSVDKPANAVWVRIPWRRRDERPENKEILVVDAATNLRVTNVARVSINRELGDLLFAPPTAPGEYFIYYLPFTREGMVGLSDHHLLAADEHGRRGLAGDDRSAAKADSRQRDERPSDRQRPGDPGHQRLQPPRPDGSGRHRARAEEPPGRTRARALPACSRRTATIPSA